eukprot:scaffold41649_cov160-Amphora_coffeaeformis.AAC.2
MEETSSQSPCHTNAVKNDSETATRIQTTETNADDVVPSYLSQPTETRQLFLPWREDDSSPQTPQILDPPSLYLGRLFWLEAQSRLSISNPSQKASETLVRDPCAEPAAVDDNDHDDNDDDDEDENSPSSDDDETLQWQVHLLSRHEQRPERDPTKSWMCTICRRGFLSAFRVAQHQEVAHYDVVHQTSSSSSSSIWTTPLETVYNDDYLAVVIKPQGMAVMGDFEGKTLQRSSLLMALMPPGNLKIQGKPKFAWPQKNESINNDSPVKGEKNEESEQQLDYYLGKPRPVHRLDAPTGGLLVVAKTKRSEPALKLSFQKRECHKTYRALVYGKLEHDEGECSQALSGKPSLTRYRVLRRSRSISSTDGWVTTVELYPHTGRMHQLRKHMQMLGHPMWGDKRYGPKQKDADEWQSRLCLWAVAIRLPHPVFFPINGKEINCRMPDPEWLDKVVKHEEEIWQKVNTPESC